MKKNMIVSLLTCCVMFSFFLTGCENNTKAPAKPVAKGYTWVATKDDQSIHLVGTMHPAPSTHQLLTAPLVELIKNSDTLWVEADLTSQENISKLESSLLLENGTTIHDYLSADFIDQLSSLLKPYQIKLEQVEAYNPTGFMQLLNSIAFQEARFTGAALDHLMVEEAKKQNISVKEVEGIDYQITILSSIFTLDVLEHTIQTFDEFKPQTIKEANLLFDQYVKGDIVAANEYEAKAKEITDRATYDLLIVERNKLMLEKILNEMQDGQNHLVAVGYRHYVGDDSILKLLEAEGYTITPLEQ